jgi:hypothetical protein
MTDPELRGLGFVTIDVHDTRSWRDVDPHAEEDDPRILEHGAPAIESLVRTLLSHGCGLLVQTPRVGARRDWNSTVLRAEREFAALVSEVKQTAVDSDSDPWYPLRLWALGAATADRATRLINAWQAMPGEDDELYLDALDACVLLVEIFRSFVDVNFAGARRDEAVGLVKRAVAGVHDMEVEWDVRESPDEE